MFDENNISVKKELLNELKLEDTDRDDSLITSCKPLYQSGRFWTSVLVFIAVPSFIGFAFAIDRQKNVETLYPAQEVEERISIDKPSGPNLAPRDSTVLQASGFITPRRYATVASKFTAKIKKIVVEEGDYVNKGDPLAYLEDSDARSELEYAEAQQTTLKAVSEQHLALLKESSIQLNRIKKLIEKELISEAQYDEVVAQYEAQNARYKASLAEVESSKSRVSLQKQLLSDMVIRAPFGGVVVDKNAQPGEIISPVSSAGGFTRTGICSIVDMSSLEIEVDINELYVSKVQPGQPVEASLRAYPDWSLKGKVITIVPTADRQKATVRVRISLLEKDPRIMPDMGVKVSFLDHKNAG